MKYILIIIILFLFVSAKPQDGGVSTFPIEPPLENYIDWGNQIYSSFFNGSTSDLKSAISDEIVIFPGFKHYNQADSRWGNNPIALYCSNCITNNGVPYGVIVNNVATTRCSIRAIGCLLTCETMILSSWGYNITPDIWNNYLIKTGINGFYNCGLNPDNMHKYTKNISYIYISKQFPIKYDGPNDTVKIAKLLKAIIDNLHGLIIVKLNKIGKQGGVTGDAPYGHYCVLYGYKTSNPTLKDFLISDPGTSYDDNSLVQNHIYRRLGDYYVNGENPLYVSTQYSPTIRFFMHGMYSQETQLSINLPQTSYQTGQTLNINLPESSTKTTSTRNVVWFIEDPNGDTTSVTGESFNYFFYVPGEYCLKLAAKDGDNIYSDVKTFTVTGRCIPKSCYGFNISDIKMTVNSKKIDLEFIYAKENLNWEYCTMFCSTPAMWLKRDGFSQMQNGGIDYETNKYWDFKFFNLEPNIYYRLKSSNVGFHCGLFSCSFDENAFFNDCYWEILTSPNTITRNSDISAFYFFEDNAINSIKFLPGFKYKAANSYIYKAKIVSGPQIMRYCGNADDNLKSAIIEEFSEKDTSEIINNISIELNSKELKGSKPYVVPNPSNGLFNLKIDDYSSNEKIKVSISDVSGKIIYNNDFYSSENIIDIRNSSKGIYLINIRYNHKNLFNKILIK